MLDIARCDFKWSCSQYCMVIRSRRCHVTDFTQLQHSAMPNDVRKTSQDYISGLMLLRTVALYHMHDLISICICHCNSLGLVSAHVILFELWDDTLCLWAEIIGLMGNMCRHHSLWYLSGSVLCETSTLYLHDHLRYK